jgi:hypothetical protein
VVVLLAILPGPDERDFLTGRENSHVSPDSVKKDSSLRFSRGGDMLLLLLLLLPRGETAREGEAEECSIVQRFRLLKATARVVGDT